MRALLLALVLATGLLADEAADAKIYDQVRFRLSGDRDVKGAALDVDVKDGIVVLRGKIPTEKLKDRAEKIARKVKGVKQVKNELVVTPL